PARKGRPRRASQRRRKAVRADAGTRNERLCAGAGVFCPKAEGAARVARSIDRVRGIAPAEEKALGNPLIRRFAAPSPRKRGEGPWRSRVPRPATAGRGWPKAG